MLKNSTHKTKSLVFDSAIVSSTVQEFRYEFQTFFVNEAHQSLTEGQWDFFDTHLFQDIENTFGRVLPKRDSRIIYDSIQNKWYRILQYDKNRKFDQKNNNNNKNTF